MSKITLYHPSPLRIDNVQHDAVLTLNDPHDTGTNVVVLIPLVGSISPGPSGAFVGKIAPYIAAMLQPDPNTKAYASVDAATGAGWDLSKVLPVTPNPRTNVVEVSSGYFVWAGMPRMEEYQVPSRNPYQVRYDWRPAGTAPTYIMMKNPIEISSFDLQSIRMLPMTPAGTAIHTPVMSTLTYKPGPAGSDVVGCRTSTTGTVERFDNQCDPLQQVGQPSGTFRLDSGQVITMLSSLIGIIATVIAVYFALKVSVDPKYGKIVGTLGAKLGRAMSGAAAPIAAAAAALPAVAPPPPPVVDETAFDVQNPLRQPRRPSTPGRSPSADVARTRGLSQYKAPSAPSSRRPSAVAPLTPEQVNIAIAAEPEPPPGSGVGFNLTPAQIEQAMRAAPVRRRNLKREDSEFLELEAADAAKRNELTPEQIAIARAQEPEPGAGTGLAEALAQTRRDEPIPDDTALTPEQLEAAERSEQKARDAVKKAKEETEAAAKKAQEDADKAEDARLAAQDEVARTQIRQQAPRVAALEADVARRRAAFDANKKVLEKAKQRAEEMKKKADEAKKEATQVAKMAPMMPYKGPLWNKLKAIETPKVKAAVAAAAKAEEAATAAVPKAKSSLPPMAPNPLFEARRQGFRQREGIKTKNGGKHTRRRYR